MIEKFNANTNAEKIIQTRLENILYAIESKDIPYLESCILAAESILIANDVSDIDFLKESLALKKKHLEEYDKKYKAYEKECADSLCGDVIDKPKQSASLDHLLARNTLIIEYCQRKGIFLRVSKSFHHGVK